MENSHNSLLSDILNKFSPADIESQENRALISQRIEKLMHHNGWSRRHFAVLMRREVVHLRIWLGNTYVLTTEGLTELCGLLSISMGDLVAE